MQGAGQSPLQGSHPHTNMIYYPHMKQWKTKQLKDLSKTLISLKTEADMLAFLRDVATLEELGSISRRWEAAQMIEQGVPYRDISKHTGLSTATVTRVAHWIKHGEGGYRAALKK